nr:MAG TPA: hypothetical protein [Caudoviricetes sp.]
MNNKYPFSRSTKGHHHVNDIALYDSRTNRISLHLNKLVFWSLCRPEYSYPLYG